MPGQRRRNRPRFLHRTFVSQWSFGKPACSTGMKPSRTLSRGLSGPRAIEQALKTESGLTGQQAVPKTCCVCGTALRPDIRSSAVTCSSKCRSIKSRQHRLHQVAQRLQRAELALRQAADGLAEYRQVLEANLGKVAP